VCAECGGYGGGGGGGGASLCVPLPEKEEVEAVGWRAQCSANGTQCCSGGMVGGVRVR